MSNLHRILWIDARIKEGRYPNSRIIAERFEISQRQAQRDVEYLKYSMGAPVEYSAQNNGYFYSDNTYELPSGYLTEKEKNTLSYLSSQYRLAGGSDATKLAELFSRLGGETAAVNYPEQGNSIKPILVGRNNPENFLMLEKALKLNRKVEMEYSNSNGDVSTRIFHPYKLFNKGGADYSAGFCELRNEIRVFRVSRIQHVKLLEESFSIVKHYNEKDYGPDAGFNYKEPYTAIVEFDEKPVKVSLGFDMFLQYDGSADRPASESTYANNKNIYGYKISFSSSAEILGKLLSLGIPFRIVRPAWLKERLAKRLNSILTRNL